MMKNIVVLVFIFLVSNTSFAQSSDKLTLKGGVMLGVPRFDGFDYIYARRGMNVYPRHEGSISFNNTVGVFGGVEYFPWSIKLSDENLYLYPFTSLNFNLYSTDYNYEINDVYRGKFEGQYKIVSFFPSMSFGFKISLEKYRLEILASADIIYFLYFYRGKVLKHEYNTSSPYYRNNDEEIKKYSSPYVGFTVPRHFQLDFRYKLNKKLAIQLGYKSAFLGSVNTNNFVTPVGNDYPVFYHKISLGVTYQLLSHKNKTVENVE